MLHVSEEPLYLALYERMPESRKGTDEYSQMLENRVRESEYWYL